MQTARQSIIPTTPQINSEVKLILSYSLENTQTTQTPDGKVKVEPSDPVPRRLPLVPSTTEVLEPCLDNTHKMANYASEWKCTFPGHGTVMSNGSLESHLAGQSWERQYDIFLEGSARCHLLRVSTAQSVIIWLWLPFYQRGPREASLPLGEKSPAA